MSIPKMFRACLMGVALAAIPTAPAFAQALRLAGGETQSALRVPLNRAIVLESEVPFAELSVANPLIADIATLSERSIYVLGKAPGRTTLTLLGIDGRLLTNVEVRVTPDIAEFKERLGELLPGERIEVRTANDGIVLSGTVSSIQKVDQALEIAERYAPERVLNLMVVGGSQQVLLKVRFAEMSRSVTKALGANVGLVGTGLGGDVTLNGTANNGVGNNNGTFTLGFPGGTVAVNLTLQALENKGLVRTLAEPVPSIPSTPVYERSHSDVTGTAGDGRKCVPPAREPDRSTEGSNKDHGGGVESSIIGGAGPAVLKDVNES